MEIALNGILSGIVLAFLIGPVFFTILQTSIEHGFKSGAWVAVGVSLSDSLYIFISYFGVYQFFENLQTRQYLSYVGGLILILFGLYYLFIKNKQLHYYRPEKVKTHHPLKLIIKGFLINGLSPMVLLFWIGTVGVATTEFKYTQPLQMFIFAASIVFTVFVTDLIKAKLADRLRAVMTPRTIRILNIVLGLVLVGFGGRLIFTEV